MVLPVEEGEDISGLIEQASPEVEKQPQEKALRKGQKKKIPPPLPQEHVPSGVRASPLARQVAKESGINLQSVQGSGPGGRIIKEDIEQIIKRKSLQRLQLPNKLNRKSLFLRSEGLLPKGCLSRCFLPRITM